MKKRIKKGFTLVELLVVIGILAVLAVVSVVGYFGFIKKAHVSNDIGLTTQMNTILGADEAGGETFNTPHDAIDALKDGGLDVTKLTPTTNGYNYVYDSKQHKMFLLDENKTKVAPENLEMTKDENQLYAFIGNESEISSWSNYSLYLKDNFVTTTTLNVNAGLDVGDNEGINAKYESDSDKAVTIRTNGGSLTINAANGIVYHYGSATNVEVKAIKGDSYHEYGFTRECKIESGHLVVEQGGYFGVLNASSETSVDVKGEVEIYQGSASTTTVSGYIGNNQSTTYDGPTGTRADVSFEISSVQDMNLFKYQVECGRTFKGVTVNLNKDLDLGNFDPIGSVNFEQDGVGGAIAKINGATYFSGIFNGNNHTLKYSATNINGDYGLFMTLGSTDKNNYAEVKNLKMNVNLVASDTSTWIGALADYAFGYLKITDCEVSGNIESGKVASGFIGWCVTIPTNDKKEYIMSEENVQFVRCTNNANITVKFHSDWALVGGICSQVGGGSSSVSYNYSFTDCVNNGTLTATGIDNPIIGEILGQGQSYGTVNIKGCKKDSGKWIGRGASFYGSGFVENITE